MNHLWEPHVQQFNRMFPDEEACIRYLTQTKWPDGFHCPKCRHNKAYIVGTRSFPLFQCRECSHQTSLTASTVMEKSRTPLSKWLLVFYLLSASSTSRSINAAEICSVIQVTYKTAWSMLHKIKAAISSCDEQTFLEGNIVAACIQHGYISGLTNKPQPQVSPISVCISKVDNRNEYIKIKLMPEGYTRSTLMLPPAEKWLQQKYVSPDSSCVSQLRIITRHADAREEMANIRTLAANARKWINTTFRGLKKKHLQSYFDLYCFSRNHREQPVSCLFETLARSCLGLRLIP